MTGTSLTSLALAFTLALVVSAPAGAVESGGVGGKPANPRSDNPRSQSIFIHEIQPGRTVQDAVQIINNTDDVKKVDVYGVDSQVSSGGAFACAQKADVATNAGEWITVERTTVDVAPKNKATVPFTITVPENADVGEHNACIAFQAADQVPQSAGNGITLSFRSAIRVVVTVPGDIKKELTIKGLDVEEKNNEVIVTPTLKNTGNVSLDTKLEVGLQGLFGSQTDGGTFPVLNGREAENGFSFARPFWGGWYLARVSASYVSDPAVSLGEETEPDKVLQTSSTVFIAPAPAAAGIMIASLAVLAGLITFLIRRQRDRAEERQSAIKYRVERGDDIQSVASEHGVNWKTLVRLNDLKPPYTLRPGQHIRIPTSASRSQSRRRKG
ncbi:LysM peptidoglycan-binding domain-containing protein [Candidatus Saccharibacteria bacterium]|nr:LysM peptidoglycan-binding domain-containing protein [Candidatus Saccharibacteria bacterium]